ncbi:radical SAM protein, partial [Planctomycetota bacterium]
MADTCVVGEQPVYLSTSRGTCRRCRRMVPVRYMADGAGVYLERLCPEHGKARAQVAESLAWYLEALAESAAARPPKRVVPRVGQCPSSCGPCGFHAQQCNLPVFSITNGCNLSCPICFTYNRADKTYNMSKEEFERHLDFVVDATGGVDLVNVTGGEPTTHPRLLELLECAKRPEIGRITLNSNGLILARDPDLARQLAELGVYVVLSLNTLDPATSVRLHGRDITREKRQALENLQRFSVQTTLLMVLAGGVNEGDLKDLLDQLTAHDFVRSLTVQTMTYTGQGGGAFLPRQHIPVDGVERRIAEASGARIRLDHFMPLPTAHPLCYGVAYFIADDRGALHGMTDLLDPSVLSSHLSDGYLLRPSAALEVELKLAIDRLWSQGDSPRMLATLKHMLQTIYPVSESLSPHERQRRAEK